MHKRLIPLALSVMPAPAVLAQGPETFTNVRTVSVTPSVSAYLHVDAAGHVAFAPAGAPTLSEVDRNALQNMQLRYDDPQELAKSTGANSVPIPAGNATAPVIMPNAVKVSMFAVRGKEGKAETLLILENGYGQALRYRAALARGQRDEPTDVCTVLPGKRGYEHWPYAIDRIDLAAISLVPYREGDRPVCE